MNPEELKKFVQAKKLHLVIAADAEPRVNVRKNGKISEIIPGGGVSIALDPILQAAGGVFIARAKTAEDREVSGGSGKSKITGPQGSYTLRRLFFDKEIQEDYYSGFSNQTLWPLCHVAFEAPVFDEKWYENYAEVNKKFAKAINEESKPKSFIWIHDYQLALVPSMIKKPKDSVIGMFWHIPWPTWEAFRILPQKREILESLLSCDFLGFHRGYQVRNFLDTVRRELEVRIDDETGRVYYKNHVTTVKNLPLGIDTDVLKNIASQNPQTTFLGSIMKKLFGQKEDEEKKENDLDEFFRRNKVIIGVDRLDYTKGLRLRLKALDRFFQKYPKYVGKVVYLGILSPSRESIPSYKRLKDELKILLQSVNLKYVKKGWVPIHLIYSTFTREDVMKFYQKSKLCLVTPLDDGMNLVSKEFVIASSFEKDPGMLVLSQFAGSAIDLTRALIINPYDIEQVADSIKAGLEMDKSEKRRRIKAMAETLESKNAYRWSKDFIEDALDAAR